MSLYLSLLLCWSLWSGLSSAAEPTVIFLGANGRPAMLSSSSTSGSLYGSSSTSSNSLSSASSSAPYTISTIKAGSSSEKREGPGTLASIANVIRDRLGEKFQERQAKKGPRIIVIPQSGNQQNPQSQQTQATIPRSQTVAAPVIPPYLSTSYGSTAYANPYPYAAASAYQATYLPSPYSHFAQNPYGQSYSSYSYPSTASSGGGGGSSNTGSSSSSPFMAASNHYPSYAVAPSSILANLLASQSPNLFKSNLFNSYSLIPYLANLLALYGA